VSEEGLSRVNYVYFILFTILKVLLSLSYVLQIAFWIEVSIAEVSISAGRFFTSYFTLHCASLFSISDVKLPSTNHTVKASDI
jgi:hypothetical protein